MATAKLFVWYANAKKLNQRKKLIDTELENNINTVAEELVSSENVVGIFWCIIIIVVSDGEVYFSQQTVEHCCIQLVARERKVDSSKRKTDLPLLLLLPNNVLPIDGSYYKVIASHQFFEKFFHLSRC